MYGGTGAIAGGCGQDGIVLQIVRTSVHVARVVCVHEAIAELDSELDVAEN